MTNILKDKIKGSLYGLAIGDALGATTEFLTDVEIHNFYNTRTEIIGQGWLKLNPGEVTDPTEIAFCVCNAYEYIFHSYLHNSYKKFSYETCTDFNALFLNKCCDTYTAWYDSYPVDMEECCKNVIRKCRNTDYKIWISFSLKYSTFESSNLFGCLPLILCGQDTKLILSVSHLTHNNHVCDTYLLNFYQLMRDCLENKYIHPFSAVPHSRHRHIQCTVTHAAQHLLSSSCFEYALLDAVNQGGDTNAIAALTGSLAGARYGFHQIPERWISQLQPDVREKLDHYTEVLSFTTRI